MLCVESNQFVHLFPKFSDSLRLNKCYRCKGKYGFTEDIIIWGNGNIDADLMIIGKDSAKSDLNELLWKGSPETGMPLTNRHTGLKFRRFLEEVGISLSSTFITNFVKCNIGSKIKKYSRRTIFLKLAEECKYYIEKEIAIVRPKSIITLGDSNVPLRKMINDDQPLPIPGFALSEFMKKTPQLCIGKFSNGVKAKIFFLKHPSYINGGKREENYLKNLCIIRNRIQDNK